MYFLSKNDIPLDAGRLHYLQTTEKSTRILTDIRFGSTKYPPRLGRSVEVFWPQTEMAGIAFLNEAQESDSINITFNTVISNLDYMMAGILEVISRQSHQLPLLIVGMVDGSTAGYSPNAIHRVFRQLQTRLESEQNVSFLLVTTDRLELEDPILKHFCQLIEYDPETDAYTVIGSSLNKVDDSKEETTING